MNDPYPNSFGNQNAMSHNSPPSELATEPVGIRSLVESVIDCMQETIVARGIEVTIDVPNDIRLLVDAAALRSALSKLVSASLSAMPNRGQLEITCCMGMRGLNIEVADSGPGLIDAGQFRREPAVDVEPSAWVNDLRNAQHIASALGGHLSALNCPEGGAAFTLHFPLSRAKQAAA